MKMRFLLLLFLLAPSTPAKAGSMAESDGYIVLASIIGAVSTGASCLLWYFHQKVLKEDFLKKEVDLQNRITLLEGVLGIPVPGNVNMRVVENPIQPLEAGVPISLHGGDTSEESGTPPPPFDAAWVLPENFFLTMPEDSGVLGEQNQRSRVRHPEGGRYLVGSLVIDMVPGSVSPVVMQTAFPGAEEA